MDTSLATDIVDGDNLCRNSRHVHIVAQTIVDVKFLSCIYCRRRQYIPKFGAYIVAQLCKTYFRDHEGRNMIASVNGMAKNIRILDCRMVMPIIE